MENLELRKISSQGCVWIPAPPPSQHTETNLQVVGVTNISPGITNITFTVSGPSRVMLLINTRGNVSLGRSPWEW